MGTSGNNNRFLNVESLKSAFHLTPHGILILISRLSVASVRCCVCVCLDVALMAYSLEAISRELPNRHIVCIKFLGGFVLSFLGILRARRRRSNTNKHVIVWWRMDWHWMVSEWRRWRWRCVPHYSMYIRRNTSTLVNPYGKKGESEYFSCQLWHPDWTPPGPPRAPSIYAIRNYIYTDLRGIDGEWETGRELFVLIEHKDVWHNRFMYDLKWMTMPVKSYRWNNCILIGMVNCLCLFM